MTRARTAVDGRMGRLSYPVACPGVVTSSSRLADPKARRDGPCGPRHTFPGHRYALIARTFTDVTAENASRSGLPAGRFCMPTS